MRIILNWVECEINNEVSVMRLPLSISIHVKGETKRVKWCCCVCSLVHLYKTDLAGCCHLDLVLLCTRCVFEPVLLTCCRVPAVLGAGRWHQRPNLAQEHDICSVCLHIACQWALDLPADRCHLPGLAVTCQHNHRAELHSSLKFWTIFCRLLAMALQLPAGELWVQPSLLCLNRWTVCG